MANVEKRIRRNKLALVIPAHNEELVILHTIKSALKAGQKKQHIYVVDDNSSDATSEIARKALPKENIIKVRRSGKGFALQKAVKKLKLAKHYQWIHIADADGVFGKDYFRIFKSRLNTNKYAAATGYVQSLPGNWISQYRTYEYTFGLEIMRRIQHRLGVIPVIPGPTSCFRSDVIKKIDFQTGNLTEDFDVTIQIHRQKLGKIAYFPEAKAFTQDPKNLRDYCNQINRWNRGFFQGVLDYKIGRRAQKIDLYLGYQLYEMVAYYVQILFVLPLLILAGNAGYMLAMLFLIDFLIFFGISVMAAVINRRPAVITAFPTFYIIRGVNMFIFLKSFVEVIILRRFRAHQLGWSTEGRRYQISARA